MSGFVIGGLRSEERFIVCPTVNCELLFPPEHSSQVQGLSDYEHHDHDKETGGISVQEGEPDNIH